MHKDLFEMGAAYLYHILKNHPFIDGNKRTGVVVAIAFMEFNGAELDIQHDQLFNLAIEVASSLKTKEDIATVLRGSTRNYS